MMKFIFFVAFLVSVVFVSTTVASEQHISIANFRYFVEKYGQQLEDWEDTESMEKPTLRTQTPRMEFLELWSHAGTGCEDLENVVDFELNACIPWEEQNETKWAYLTAKQVNGDVIFTNKFFSDSKCTTKSLKTRKVNLGAVDKCHDGMKFVARTNIPKHFDNSIHGVALEWFTNQSKCSGNDVQQTNQLLWAPYNICQQDASGDWKWTGCDSTSAWVVGFASTDGSCSGDSLQMEFSKTDACPANTGAGWRNYKCM
jgi:hypothetical protein